MSDTRYWRSLEERAAEPGALAARPEFPELEEGPGFLSMPLSRRGFLKTVGFSLGASLLSACGRGPANKVLSALSQPEELVPGRSDWYSSACQACAAGCGLLVKERDGRPLKLEGLPEHPLSRGGLCAAGQASVLGLYDDRRLKGPLSHGAPTFWQAADQAVAEGLEKAKGRPVRFLSHTVTSPTLTAGIQRFLARFKDARHVVYDPLSASALLEAHALAFGPRLLPRPRLEKARVVAAFDADFLGTWVSPVEYAAAYRAARAPSGPRFLRHIQVESRMSLTGANADLRLALAPHETALLLAHLASELSRRAGLDGPARPAAACPGGTGTLGELADALWEARGESLVLCGTNDLAMQVSAVFCNAALKAYGGTLDVERPSYQRRGDDKAVQELLAELKAGKVGALFILGANPVAELPESEAWRKALAAPGLVVSLATHADETSTLAHVVAADRHPLETWSDVEPADGLFGLAQPAVQPLADTRPALESLAAWGGATTDALDAVRAHWREKVHPRVRKAGAFDSFWDDVVEAGFAEAASAAPHLSALRAAAARAAAAPRPAPAGGLTLGLYPTVALLDGRHAGNPWLQELPDPVTKVAWDNHASFSPAAARRLGLSDGDVVRLAAPDGRTLELPAHVQPGQHDEVVAVALGYGRQASERFVDAGPSWIGAKPGVGPDGRVGVNAAGLLTFAGGICTAELGGVSVTRLGSRRPLACSQDYHTLAVPPALASRPGETRDAVRETTLAEYRRDPASGNESEGMEQSLWPEHPYEGHRWGMAVDLSACNGCSACVIACQAENNVPVVGKDEVARRRDMAWLRIDRYYAGDGPDADVVFQPMMCQHCGNAPCETVCPVLATMHSDEGLNQQVYNRCVGTRYCENNCPYKTRRFNWFQYQKPDRLSNLALNPDVTVRVRGVMEKCSFCVQRIQEAKSRAKAEGRALADGDVAPACAQSCPAQAIVFGDVNDPKSRVSQLRRDARHYRVLAELNVRPSVGYLVKVRDRAEGKEGGHV